MIFGKNKTSEPPVTNAVNSAPVKNINPDDFFQDMGRKPKQSKPAEVKAEIESPEITGLREAPEEIPPSTLAAIGTENVSADTLIDKAALDDGAYHGNMDNIDENAVDVGTLDVKTERTVPAESPASAAVTRSGAVDADDFFKDMGKKAKKKEENVNIEAPDVVGLRETPAPVLPSTLDDIGINVGEIDTNILPDKTLLDDGLYHGTLQSI